MITETKFIVEVGVNFHSGKHIKVSATTIRKALSEANRMAPNMDVFQITYHGEIIWDSSNGLMSNCWFKSVDERPKSEQMVLLENLVDKATQDKDNSWSTNDQGLWEDDNWLLRNSMEQNQKILAYVKELEDKIALLY